MQVRCPKCKKQIALDESSSLDDIDCASCGAGFSVTEGETLDYLRDDETHVPADHKLAHFELVAKVGMGSYGTVWRAIDTDLDRTVAIKIPRKDKLSRDETEKFLREARAAAQLKHPHIVGIHEVGRDGDTVFIVSDFVHGQTLSDWLETAEPSPKQAAELVAKIAAALHHAHEAGVIHRDVKPSNVMLDAKDEPAIMDFGLARREATDVTLTIAGSVMGTPAYMSPEQASGEGHHADRRSDVYSLGVMLFELLTGERPFRGSARMVIEQVINDDAPHPRKLNQSVPEDVDTICLKCLEKPPSKRYQTAGELAEELRRFVRDEPIQARRITRPARAWRWCKRHPVESGLAAGLLISLVAGLAGVTTQWLRANANASRAETAADSEREAREETEANLYVADMNSAQRALELADTARAIELLSRHGPDSGRSDKQRSFEWYYWWRQTHQWSQSFEHAARGVNAVAVTADGKTIASGSADGVIRIWNAASGELRHTLTGHQDQVFSLAFKRDSTTLASGGIDKAIQLWNVETGKRVRTLKGHEGTVFSLKFIGSQLASCGSDLTVKWWDTESGEHETFNNALDSHLTQQLIARGVVAQEATKAHIDFIYAVAVSPKAGVMATAGLDRRIVIWSVASGQPLKVLSAHDLEVWSLAFSPDGTKLVSGSGDMTIKVWDVGSGEEMDTLKGHTDRVRAVEFLPDGRLLSASQDRTIRVWNLDAVDPPLEVPIRKLDRTPKHFFERMQVSRGKLQCTLIGHTSGVTCLAASADGRSIVSGSSDRSVKRWSSDVIDEQVVLDDHEKMVNAARFSHDGTRLASAGNDRSVRLWNGQTGEPAGERLLHGDMVWTVAWSPDDEIIAAGGADGSVTIWRVASGESRALVAHQGPVSCVAFSPDGILLASASHDGTIKVWRSDTGELVADLKGHSGKVYAVLFSDEENIMSAAADGSVSAWSALRGELIMTIKRHYSPVWALALSPDQRILASASQDKTVILWDFETLTVRAQLSGHADRVQSLAFSPDGRTLASGSSDKTIKLWDMTTLEPKTTLKGHGYRVSSLDFAPDGKTLASSSYVIRLWRTTEEP